MAATDVLGSGTGFFNATVFNLTVDGTFTASGSSPTVIENLLVTGTAAVDGVTRLEATEVKSTLLVDGSSTLLGAAQLQSTLAVAGASTLTGAAELKSTLLVDGASTLTGATELKSTLLVDGTSVLTGGTTASTIGATSVTFNSGTQTALAVYNEGVFTPTLVLATPGGTPFVFTVQTGTFTRIGNRVFVQGQMSWSQKDNGTGVLTITGLPYTANAAALLQIVGPVGGTSIGLSAQTTSASTTLQVWNTGVTGAPGYNQATSTNIPATLPGTMDFSGSYLTTQSP